MGMGTSNFDFYEKLFSKLDTALTNYWFNVANDISDAITPVATTLVTIYVMLWGWSMMRGVISEPITDGVTRIVRMALITGLALSVLRYSDFLATMLWTSPDALASHVASGYSNSTNSMQFLDKLMERFYDTGKAYNDEANADAGVMGIPDLSLWITGVVVWIAGILVTGYAAFLYALSKMALAILLGVGPIFILMTLFEPTKRFFDAWLGQALNYVFVVMLTAAAVKLVITIIDSYLGGAAHIAAMTSPKVNQAIPAIVFSMIGVLVMMQLPSVASALGGGVAIGTLGAVGWAYSKTKGTFNALRPTNLKRSVNKIRSDFRIAANAARSVGSGAKAVGGAPMAVYRKITGSNKNRG